MTETRKDTPLGWITTFNLMTNTISIFLWPYVLLLLDKKCIWESYLFYRIYSFNFLKNMDIINSCQIGSFEIYFIVLMTVNILCGLRCFFSDELFSKTPSKKIIIRGIVIIFIFIIGCWTLGSLPGSKNGFMIRQYWRMIGMVWNISPLAIWLLIALASRLVRKPLTETVN